MQTNFTLAQLKDPDTAVANHILRTCVHCGFCTATCPTYVLLGDELDSPRGRIYLMKDMLENQKKPTQDVVKHIDRCLSCLSCMTTCPSGVHYMHLVDHGRAYIEKNYKRPAHERAMRNLLAAVIPRPRLFRMALMGAWASKPLAGMLPGRLGAMMGLAPDKLPPPSPVHRPQTFPAKGQRKARVALLSNCAQQVIAPHIDEATVRLLTRHGVEVVVAKGAGCCGALNHHMGDEEPALRFAKANIDAWTRELERGGLDAVVINASGCGTTVKDYGFMFRDDPAYAEKAKRISLMTKDVTELMTELGLMPAVIPPGRRVTYQSACSMQHGQRIRREPKALLQAAGFRVGDVPEAHLCCGSAGTYNLLQPEIASQLQERKVANVELTKPEIVASGNIGCITQIAAK